MSKSRSHTPCFARKSFLASLVGDQRPDSGCDNGVFQRVTPPPPVSFRAVLAARRRTLSGLAHCSGRNSYLLRTRALLLIFLLSSRDPVDLIGRDRVDLQSRPPFSLVFELVIAVPPVCKPSCRG